VMVVVVASFPFPLALVGVASFPFPLASPSRAAAAAGRPRLGEEEDGEEEREREVPLEVPDRLREDSDPEEGGDLAILILGVLIGRATCSQQRRVGWTSDMIR
jgi:hypothetical protein